MTIPTVGVDSKTIAASGANPTNVNNAQVIKHPTTLNFGGLIQPYEGSITNGGFGGAFSRLVSTAIQPFDTLALKGELPSAKSLVKFAAIAGGAFLLFRLIRGRK